MDNPERHEDSYDRAVMQIQQQIRPACLSGVKLQVNGITVAAAGVFNTSNLATGIFT